MYAHLLLVYSPYKNERVCTFIIAQHWIASHLKGYEWVNLLCESNHYSLIKIIIYWYNYAKLAIASINLLLMRVYLERYVLQEC